MAASGLAPERQPELLEQPGDAVEVELQAVALGERGALLRRGRRGGRHPGGLREETLEARRGDDLEDPLRLVARVPERVPLVAGLEDEVAGPAEDDLVAELRPHAALEDVAV